MDIMFRLWTQQQHFIPRDHRQYELDEEIERKITVFVVGRRQPVLRIACSLKEKERYSGSQ